MWPEARSGSQCLFHETRIRLGSQEHTKQSRALRLSVNSDSLDPVLEWLHPRLAGDDPNAIAVGRRCKRRVECQQRFGPEVSITQVRLNLRLEFFIGDGNEATDVTRVFADDLAVNLENIRA